MGVIMLILFSASVVSCIVIMIFAIFSIKNKEQPKWWLYFAGWISALFMYLIEILKLLE